MQKRVFPFRKIGAPACRNAFSILEKFIAAEEFISALTIESWQIDEIADRIRTVIVNL